MSRLVAVRTARQVASPGTDSASRSRLSSGCWRCRLSSSLSASMFPLFAPHFQYRLLHVSSAARSEPPPRSSCAAVEERIDGDVDGAGTASWSPRPSLRLPRLDLSDVMKVARRAESQAAKESPLHQTLLALVEDGKLSTAAAHLRSFHLAATADSWNLLLSALVHHDRPHAELSELWQLWQSVSPPVDSPLPVDCDRQLLPNATTYAILTRAQPPLVAAQEALTALEQRGLPTSTFLHNTLVKELIRARDLAGAQAAVDRMRLAGVPADVFTLSQRFTIVSHSSNTKGKREAQVYEQISGLWDELHALQVSNIPLSLSFCFAFFICKANDVRRLCQLVQSVYTTSAPPEYAHRARPLEMMLRCLMRNERLQEMIQLYGYMRRVGFKMDRKHFEMLVVGFARRGETHGMMRVFNEMVGHGVQPNEYMFETMLHAYGRAGDDDGAAVVVRRMSEFGVQPTANSIYLIMKGIQERRTGQGSLAEAQEVSDARTPHDEQRAAANASSSSTTSKLSPESMEYLPLFALADELSITPLPAMYGTLLSALRHEGDLPSALFFLADCKHKGHPVFLVSLFWALKELSDLTATLNAQEQSVAAHIKLMVAQAVWIAAGEEAKLHEPATHHLLSVHIDVLDVAGMQRVYAAMWERKMRITWHVYARMMQSCLEADSSEVREHDRMQFVVLLYTRLTFIKHKFGHSVYNAALHAYAVLGDTRGMKHVLAAMRHQGTELSEDTLAVLDEARDHLLNWADVANHINEQRSRITTLQMENKIRQRHSAELREAAADAQQAAAAAHEAAQPTRLSAIDEPAPQKATQALFSLPEWSPLYNEAAAQAAAEKLAAAEREEAVAAAAVEELQSALSAFISSLPSPILYAQQFPTSDVGLVQQLDDAVAASPTAKQVLAISKQLQSLKKAWPLAAGQKARKRRAKPSQVRADHAHTAAADNNNGAAHTSDTRICIQPIDGPIPQDERPPTSPDSHHRLADSVAEQLGLLSTAAHPSHSDFGHIDLAPRAIAAGTVLRATRYGSIGRLPPFSAHSALGTVTERRLRAAMSRQAEERSRLPAKQSPISRPRAPVLPLPPLRVQSAAAFTTIDSHADAAVLNNDERRKRRARKTAHSAAAAAEGGASRAKQSKMRDPYHGGWLD